jgi:hypothetical protein
MAPDMACSVAPQPNESTAVGAQADHRSLRICIGGVLVSVHCDFSACIPIGTSLDFFRSNLPISDDIRLRVRWVDWLPEVSRKPCFNSGAVWSLRSRVPEFVFDFQSPAFGAAPYERMLIRPDFRDATLLLNQAALAAYPNINPLQYPADELLFTNYLAHHGLGVEVHGCGLIDLETGGHLFLGHSGAGKSTTSRLWKSMRDAEILSDDRVILRLHEGELWMYGTPWHGEEAFVSADRAPVNKIFVLQHGQRNCFAKIPHVRAVAELFVRSFPPFHSSAGLANTVDFLDRALANTPCYEFEFTPDARAIDAVLQFHD